MPLSRAQLGLQAWRWHRWRSRRRQASVAEVSPRQVSSGSMQLIQRWRRWWCRWYSSVACWRCLWHSSAAAGVTPCRALALIGAGRTVAGVSSSRMGRLLCCRGFGSIPPGVTSRLTSHRSKYCCLRFRFRSVKIWSLIPLAFVLFCQKLILKCVCSLSVSLPLELGLVQIGGQP